MRRSDCSDLKLYHMDFCYVALQNIPSHKYIFVFPTIPSSYFANTFSKTFSFHMFITRVTKQVSCNNKYFSTSNTFKFSNL